MSLTGHASRIDEISGSVFCDSSDTIFQIYMMRFKNQDCFFQIKFKESLTCLHVELMRKWGFVVHDSSNTILYCHTTVKPV